MHAQNHTNKINLSKYLQSLGTEIRFQNGEVLWKQGDRASYVFAVLITTATNNFHHTQSDKIDKIDIKHTKLVNIYQVPFMVCM